MASKMSAKLLIVLAVVAFLQTTLQHSVPAKHLKAQELLLKKTPNSLRQNSFFEWLATIFRPPVASTPVRECSECNCGIINTFRRIVNGQETEVNEYPWMAMLLIYGQGFCGAALINDFYVATAAHCLWGYSANVITVRLLAHYRADGAAEKIDRPAAELIVHDDYNPRNIDNDIALIRFKESVNMTGLLRPVCMPERNNSFANETGIVTGWGALSQGGSASSTLQELEVPILSQEACRNSSYNSGAITDNMLCAGYEEGGMDACQGDSGGPLHVVANETMEYQLAGVVSWGHGCAQPNTPGVYARVNRYNDWIANRTRGACYCRSMISEI